MEKAGLIGLVKMRFLPSDDKLSLRGSTLRAAVDEDLESGLIPFYVRLIYCIFVYTRVDPNVCRHFK